jgi:hypothetical protein
MMAGRLSLGESRRFCESDAKIDAAMKKAPQPKPGRKGNRCEAVGRQLDYFGAFSSSMARKPQLASA